MTTEMKCPSHRPYQEYMLSTWLITSDAHLSHLNTVVFARFCTKKLLFPSLPYYSFWKQVTKCIPHSRSGHWSSPSLRGGWGVCNDFIIVHWTLYDMWKVHFLTSVNSPHNKNQIQSSKDASPNLNFTLYISYFGKLLFSCLEISFSFFLYNFLFWGVMLV